MIDRNVIIDRLTEALKPLPYIYAFWLEGADANGTTDKYSDIDFWADVEDEYEDAAYEAVETALAEISPIDYKYVMNHGHPKIRQRVYHIKDTSEYLMIDFCWQLNSRAREEFIYIENDRVEAIKILFDKDNVIRYKPLNIADFAQYNNPRLAEAQYRRTQHMRAEKYVRRGQYLEAYAYYNRYVLEPIIDLLRLIFTPAHADYYLVHISQHIPAKEKERLEYFAQIASINDISERLPLAGAWFDELVGIFEK
jgi:hypothetical protein